MVSNKKNMDKLGFNKAKMDQKGVRGIYLDKGRLRWI
jgi:hypothetical protein